MSDLENFNGHGRPFVVGFGALTILKYVVTPDLGNFIDKWQAPARESEQHSAKKSFQICHTRRRKQKSEDVHKGADGLPGKNAKPTKNRQK